MKRAALIAPVVILIAASCSESVPASTTTIAATSTTATATTTTQGGVMKLSSPDFESGGAIPVRFTCDGADESPELNLTGIPEGTISLVLVMDDPDASVGTFDHWVAFDVEPTEVIPANVGDLGTAGVNSWKRLGYGGPCPPSGTHRYFFKVLALAAALDLEEGATKDEVLAASDEHVLGDAMLMGTYER
jgi:Raf kinase inhibitor-like YbhB/YbcL family protein